MSTVMVVDDSQFIRMRIVKLLTQNGYQVIEATNGEEAVQTYGQAKPDAVLMDVAMEHKNGLAALTEILQADPKAKVIMLTALGQQAIILRALQTGAKEFLVKPYEPQKLLNTLQKVLG
jgi:two-component system, chemotaxis family, chemotaxis protein CheY